MKKVFLGLFFFALLAAACDDSNDDSKDTNGTVAEIQNTALNGQWKVTYFFDTDSDETDNFTGYIFAFDTNNKVTATKATTNIQGTWSVTDDDKSNDDNNNAFDDIDFNLAFANPDDFEELSEDWEILSLSSSKIELRHVSGGNGGTDLLTFEKI